MDRFPTSLWHRKRMGVARRPAIRPCQPERRNLNLPSVSGRLRIPLRIGRRLLYVTLLVFGLLPNPVGQASQLPSRPRVARASNSVSTVFRAVSRCRPQLHERERWHIAGVIHQESQRYGYDPLFVVAMVEVESACSPTARSEDGALGLIQVKPSTGRAVAAAAGLKWRGAHMLATPVFNVRLGLRYLRQLEKRFRDPYIAIAAYNLGPQRVASMPRHRARHSHYVRKVLAHYELLLARHRPGRT